MRNLHGFFFFISDLSMCWNVEDVYINFTTLITGLLKNVTLFFFSVSFCDKENKMIKRKKIRILWWFLKFFFSLFFQKLKNYIIYISFNFHTAQYKMKKLIYIFINVFVYYFFFQNLMYNITYLWILVTVLFFPLWYFYWLHQKK